MDMNGNNGKPQQSQLWRPFQRTNVGRVVTSFSGIMPYIHKPVQVPLRPSRAPAPVTNNAKK